MLSGLEFTKVAKRKTEKDYHDLAESRGFKWVGEVFPKNVITPTWWECEKGDRWEARYNSIQQGKGCPICAGSVRKTEKDYHELAKSRGFKWVGGYLPKNTGDPTWWECEKGDRWEAVYDNIQQGSGCPICYGHVKKLEKDYHELAKNRGFKWAGEVLPKNTKVPTSWKCKKCEHTWEAAYSNIQQGNSCPTCRDMINGVPVSKPQRKLNSILHGSLNYPEGKYRIDVAIMRNSQKIAVEYDCQYWHKGREGHDVKRDNYLISCGWKVLHIKSGELVPKRKQLSIVIDYLLDTNTVIYNLYLEDWKN